jgi:hypothetical protein
VRDGRRARAKVLPFEISENGRDAPRTSASSKARRFLGGSPGGTWPPTRAGRVPGFGDHAIRLVAHKWRAPIVLQHKASWDQSSRLGVTARAGVCAREAAKAAMLRVLLPMAFGSTLAVG